MHLNWKHYYAVTYFKQYSNTNLIIIELRDLYFSHNIFRLINSRGMRWAGRVMRMVKRRGVYLVLA
jgi:hypothetical protein